MCIYIYYTHTYTILIQLYVYMYSINKHVQWTCIICISLSLYLSLYLSIYLYIYIYMHTINGCPRLLCLQHDGNMIFFLTIKSLQRSAVAQATSSCGVTRIPGIQRGKLHLDLTFKATDFTRWIVPKILIFAYLCLERCELYLLWL